MNRHSPWHAAGTSGSHRVALLVVVAMGAGPVVVPRPLLALQGPDVRTSSPAAPAPLRPVHDLGGAVVDFGRSLWAVGSSPARMSERSWLQLSGVLAVTGSLLALDEDIDGTLGTAGDPDRHRGGAHALLWSVGDYLEPLGFQGNTNVYYAGAAIVGYVTRQEWLHAPAKQILYSHWIGSLGRQLASEVIGRRRPNESSGAYDFGEGGTSLPSGHAAAVFQIATVLSHHVDRLPASVLLYGLAGAVAFQRVDSGSHWASDSWLGSAWGIAVARVVLARDGAGAAGATAEASRFTPVVRPHPGGASVGWIVRF